MELEDPGDDREQYRRLLEQTRRLYRFAARRIARNRATRGVDIAEIIERFDNLHRGLVVRIYVIVCGADDEWTSEEESLGEVLMEHVWSQTLRGNELSSAIRHAEQRCNRLEWEALVGPFGRFDELQDDVADLETLALRQANLLARVDGSLVSAEQQAIEQIVEELQASLRASKSKSSQRNVTLPAEAEEETDPQPAPVEEETPERSLEEVLADFDALVGLADVKQELRSLANYLALQQRRATEGLPATDISLHLVFTGNPGTGKTTVARLFGEAMRAMGVLDRGQLIETDRSGLVAEFAGQTGPRTHEKVDEALDGVLFIDEAYSLVATDGEDPFGREAMQALLKRAEDDRERLSIILAGYPQPMEDLLDTNPGLSSRFSRVIHFADYGPLELGRIFGRLLDRHHYQLTTEARQRVHEAIAVMHAMRDGSFGNGRTVRNLFEKAILQMANRLAHQADATREQLVTFEADDIPCDKPGPPNPRLRVSCPGCIEQTIGPTDLLGKAVRCRKCEERFVVDWGELIAGESPVDS